jgi:glutathione S-transferase
MLRLFHAPMACSLASRFGLVEAGVPHDVQVVRTWKGENKTDSYLQINPRGKVPALQTDEGILTESTAILPYIADLATEKGLFPKAATFARAKAQAWLSFLSSTVHVAYASALFLPADATTEVRAVAMDKLAAALKEMDAHLEGRDTILDGLSVCDLYLAVFSLWRAAPALSGGLPAFPNLDRFQQAILARPGLMGIVGEDMKVRSEP